MWKRLKSKVNEQQNHIDRIKKELNVNETSQFEISHDVRVSENMAKSTDE